MFFTLSGTPCVVRDYSTATCQTLTINAPAQGNSLSNLAVGDIFNAADYTITVTEATGGATGWSGKGYVSVLLPMGVTQNVAVTFDNIAINDCYELVNGKIETEYDPNKRGILDLGETKTKDVLGEVSDLLSQYNGTQKEKNEIDKLMEEFKSSIEKNLSISEENKQLALQKYNEALTLWTTLKNCSNATPNLRKSAESTEVCPNPSAISEKLSESNLYIPTIEDWMANSAPMYQTDGHYGTVYLICLMLGIENAKEIAEATEYPDNIVGEKVSEIRTTWANYKTQLDVHALTNGFHTEEEFKTVTWINWTPKTDIRTLGALFHRYGDTFAHTRLEDSLKPVDLQRMYGKIDVSSNIYRYNFFQGTSEHSVVDGKDVGEAPDMIKNRPELYKKYVRNISKIIAMKFGKSVSNVNLGLFDALADYAHQNNVSLMGIIHYHIAKFKGQNSFILPYPLAGRYNAQDLPSSGISKIARPALSNIALAIEIANYDKWLLSAEKYIRLKESTLEVTRREKLKYLPISYGSPQEPVKIKYEATFNWQ